MFCLLFDGCACQKAVEKTCCDCLLFLFICLFVYFPVLSDCKMACWLECFQNPLYFLFKNVLIHPTSLRAHLLLVKQTTRVLTKQLVQCEPCITITFSVLFYDLGAQEHSPRLKYAQNQSWFHGLTSYHPLVKSPFKLLHLLTNCYLLTYGACHLPAAL